jgi:hypothetical protein
MWNTQSTGQQVGKWPSGKGSRLRMCVGHSFWGNGSIPKQIVVIMAHSCDYTKNKWGVSLEWVNCIIYESCYGLSMSPKFKCWKRNPHSNILIVFGDGARWGHQSVPPAPTMALVAFWEKEDCWELECFLCLPCHAPSMLQWSMSPLPDLGLPIFRTKRQVNLCSL